jgi:putative ABC transport system substrate-binding protein
MLPSSDRKWISGKDQSMLCHAKTIAALVKKSLCIIAAIVATTLAFGAQAQGRDLTNAGPAAVAEPFAKWFRYDDIVKANWKIIADAEDPLRLEIVPGDGSSVSSLRIEPRFRVMVLYPRPSSAYDAAITKILNVFSDRGIEAEFKIFNFDRTDSRGFQAIKLAEASDIDLIFTMGSESTAWLWNHYKGGTIPVVSVTSKDPVILGQARNYDRGTSTNFAFTSLNMPVAAQLAYVFELRPELRNLAVLVDSKNVSAMQTQARPIAETATAKGIRVLNLEVQNPENARTELAALVSEAVSAMRKNDVNLENSLFWITGSTSVFREIQTINRHADRVPVLSVVPEVVQEGDNSAVLSIGISFESNAHLAAIYAIKVLEGEVKVGDLKVGVVSPPDIAINFRKAREIGLKIPFSFVEGANYIFDYDGKPVRHRGKHIPKS